MARRAVKRLQVVKTPHERAAILHVAKGVVPGIKGVGDTDLVCGDCGGLIVQGAEGLPPMATETQLLATCGTCEAYNVLPAKLAN